MCSATSHGMPGMSDGFHVKTSRLARRKSTSLHSYLAGSWVPIRTVLVGSVGSIPTALVSSSGRKAVEEVGLLQSGTAGVDDSLSYGSSDKLMTAVVSSKCSRSHVKACEKALLTVMTPFGPNIFSLR